MAKPYSYQPAGQVDVSTTGNIDDLDFSKCALIRMSNAADATIRGLLPGFDGQEVAIISVGAGHVFLSPQNAGSAAAGRFINYVTSGDTPLAAGVGSCRMKYDATSARWRMIGHDQGAYITPTFAAGTYTASGSLTWTVDSADVTTFAYYLSGRSMSVVFFLLSTSTGGVASTALQITIPLGMTTVFQARNTTLRYSDAGGAAAAGFISLTATSTLIRLNKMDGANWSNAAANNTEVEGEIFFGVN